MYRTTRARTHTKLRAASSRRQARRTQAVTAAELLRLAGELETLVLTFPQEPSDEVQAAAQALKLACQHVTSIVSPCQLLRLPEEMLLRTLCLLNSRDLAALACSCHALSDGSPCILIERGANDALNKQYSTELASLPPKSLRAHARLRWLEKARKQAQRWLKSVHNNYRQTAGQGQQTLSDVVWPKSERNDEPPTASWIEAVARFAGDGRDLSQDARNDYTSDKQGDYAEEGVHHALLCLLLMARRSGEIAGRDSDDYDTQTGSFPLPTISEGAVQWVAEKVPDLGEVELKLAQSIMDLLLQPFRRVPHATAVRHPTLAHAISSLCAQSGLEDPRR